jgi:hypothetical protein
MTQLIKFYIISLVLVFAFEFLNIQEVNAQTINTYEQAIQQANKYNAAGKYMDAKSYYQFALKFKPNDAYAKKKINEIINILSSQMDKEDEYYDIIDKADIYFDENALDKALEFYNQALKVIPGDEYAKNRIQKIYEIKADESQKLNQYKEYINQGDAALAQNKYDEAVSLYKEASSLFHDNPVPKDKIKTATKLKSEYEKKIVNFNEKVTEAEHYLLIKKYADALNLYKEAQKIFPDNTEIALKIEELMPKAKNQLLYNKKVEEADELYINKNFAAAKERYKEAERIWPENSYASDMINRINEQLELQTKDLDKSYSMAIISADSLFSNEDYESAKAQYNLALSLKPDEQYPKDKLNEIDNIYAKRKAEMQKQYVSIIKLGDSLFNALLLDDAKKQYELALSIRPDEKYPSEQLLSIEKKSAELKKAQKLKMQYDALITEADNLYKNGHYDLAINKYKEAQVLGAMTDNYPEKRINEIQQILADAQKAKEINDSYNKQIILATRLKSQDNLEEARKAYVAALEIKPDEQLPKEQIAEIDRLIEEKKLKAENDRKYKAAIKSADSLLALKLYDPAIEAYQLASNLKPDEVLPVTQITKIKTIKSNIEREARRKQAYEKFIKTGDSLINAQDYELAKVQFKQALTVKPNEKYPQEKILFIDNKLKELAAEREKKFKEVITKADNNYEQGNYQDALVQYNIAKKLKPGDSHCLGRIKECNDFIDELNKKRRAEYDLVIADADKLYTSKIYDKAIANYKKALSILPSESYPQEMIDKITRFIEENSIVDIISNATVLKDNETKKYTFEPAPINVRKYNYFLLRAKNVGGKAGKLLFTYGSKNGKNGGFVVNIPEGTEQQDYLIRVGNQYKWFSEDNNWITIFPQNTDIEIDLLRISKSN